MRNRNRFIGKLKNMIAEKKVSKVRLRNIFYYFLFQYSIRIIFSEKNSTREKKNK